MSESELDLILCVSRFAIPCTVEPIELLIFTLRKE